MNNCNFQENYLMSARDYAEFGAYQEAIAFLKQCTKEYPMLTYYEAYYSAQLGQEATALLAKAEKLAPDYCFPNKLEDVIVLRFAVEQGCVAKAGYYLGNLYYDKQQWEESLKLWEASAEADDTFATCFRNFSLVYYNKCGDKEKAKAAMERAFALNESDVRIFLELDQLYKKLGFSFEERLTNYEARKALTEDRFREAEECYELATIGTDEPAGAMYYNDQPADMILYQGLSFLKLGKVREARARFYRLIDYGEQHLNDVVKIEYFAVSLPEFLIFDENYTDRNRAHCYYLMALGNMGLGNHAKAADFIKQAVAVEPSHMMCRVYGNLLM